MTTGAREKKNASLIDELVADLSPVRPVRLASAYAAALALQFGFVALAAAWMGIAPSALVPMVQGPMGLLLGVLVISAAACGLLAVRMSIPGRYVSPLATAGLASVPLLLAALVFLVSPSMPDWARYRANFFAGLACLVETTKLALPAWILSILLLRRLAPLGPTAVGLFAGLTALLQGAILVQVVCPQTEPFHLALSHYAPLIVVSVLASGVSGWLLRLAGSPRRAR